MQVAIGALYLLGAVCWITNSTVSGWSASNSTWNEYLLGTTAVLGALLFHAGALCQLWDALNNKQQPPAFTLLSSSSKDPLKFLAGMACSSPEHVPTGSSILALQDDSFGRVQLLADALSSCRGDSGELQLSELDLSLRGDSNNSIASLTLLDRRTATPADCIPTATFTEQLADCAQNGTLPSSTACVRRGTSCTPEAAAGDAARADAHQCPSPRSNHQELQEGNFPGSLSPSSSFGRRHISATAASRAHRVSRERVCQRKDLDLDCVWWDWRPHDLNFMAGFVQVTGTTIFLMACICGFPGVLPTNYAAGDWVYWNAFFWAPFLIGSCLFITSALLSVRDCQGCWSRPQPLRRIWWMHVANTAGSIGFWLCSFFGFFAHPAERYQRWGMAFSCLWGSCFFALAAYLQLLEACS